MHKNFFYDENQIVARMKNKTCLIIGDIMLDKYLYGSVDRISPEAPIPVVNINEKKVALGGSANVACNINGYGINVILSGVVGDDFNGSVVLEELKKNNINYIGLISDSRVTTTKTRIVSKAHQIVRVDEEIKTGISKEDESQIIDNINNIISNIDVIVISDYNKGVCTTNLCKQIIELAKRNEKFIIVDPKQSNWERYSGADLITPNFKELLEALNYKIENEEKIICKNAKQLMDKFNINNILVTRSEHGMTLVSDDECITYETVAQEVYDVSGAGDTVVATLAAFLSIGMELRNATEISNIAAGIAVSKLGTYVISLEEVYDYFININKSYASKIMNIETLTKKIKGWRKDSKKIVFTNGCFDLLHIGHISYLNEAKQMGDVLIIGLNTDESVKMNKGDSRPINKQDDRARMLEALDMVDAVVMFNEETPYNLIKVVCPDVLVKGGDYKIEEIVGREFSKEVKTIQFVDGYSSTNVINRIKETM